MLKTGEAFKKCKGQVIKNKTKKMLPVKRAKSRMEAAMTENLSRNIDISNFTIFHGRYSLRFCALHALKPPRPSR